MKLKSFEFYLDWPKSIEIINLRKFIVSNLMEKGEIIRWSIVEIKPSLDKENLRQIRINAVLES